MARPRKSISSLHSPERDMEFERGNETRSASANLPTPAPLFQSSNHSLSSGRTTPSSIRRLDPLASPFSNDSSSHYTHPSIGSLPSSLKTNLELSSSSSGHSTNDTSGHWRPGRYNNSTSRTIQMMPPQHLKYSKSSSPSSTTQSLKNLDDKPLPSEPGKSPVSEYSMSKPSLMPPNSPRIATPPSTPQLSQSSITSALSPSTHVAPRSRNASGQHVVYPNPMLSVFWKANDPAEWTLDRVIYWLEYNKFGPDWIDAFRTRNLHGEEFLSLVNYQKLKSLGHLSVVNDIYDTRPSRFIHILRKVLDKSTSSTSNIHPGVDPLDETTEHRVDQFRSHISQDPELHHHDDHTTTSSNNVLRPMRSEYTLGNQYSTDGFTNTSVNTLARNRSLEDLHELDSTRMRMRPYQGKPNEGLRPISSLDPSNKSLV